MCLETFLKCLLHLQLVSWSTLLSVVLSLSENANCGKNTRMTGTYKRIGTEIFWKTNYINRRKIEFPNRIA